MVNYVAMTPEGRIFDNSLAKNAPYFIRVGTGQVTALNRNLHPAEPLYEALANGLRSALRMSLSC